MKSRLQNKKITLSSCGLTSVGMFLTSSDLTPSSRSPPRSPPGGERERPRPPSLGEGDLRRWGGERDMSTMLGVENTLLFYTTRRCRKFIETHSRCAEPNGAAITARSRHGCSVHSRRQRCCSGLSTRRLALARGPPLDSVRCQVYMIVFCDAECWFMCGSESFGLGGCGVGRRFNRLKKCSKYS
jgi:hypothetical protein